MRASNSARVSFPVVVRLRYTQHISNAMDPRTSLRTEVSHLRISVSVHCSGSHRLCQSQAPSTASLALPPVGSGCFGNISPPQMDHIATAPTTPAKPNHNLETFYQRMHHFLPSTAFLDCNARSSGVGILAKFCMDLETASGYGRLCGLASRACSELLSRTTILIEVNCAGVFLYVR